MSTVNSDDDSAEPAPKVASVSATILSQFFDELAKEPSLAEIAAAMRKMVLEDGVFSEPAIRTVMFPDAP